MVFFNMCKYRYVNGTKPGNGLFTKLLQEPEAHFYIHFTKKIS